MNLKDKYNELLKHADLKLVAYLFAFYLAFRAVVFYFADWF